jgi:hypothetical protein
MTYKAHPDDRLEAAFAASLTRQDALGLIAEDCGVSASLVSRMRLRAQDLWAEACPAWSERAVRRQLLEDGWIKARRRDYRLPARPSGRRTWIAWTGAATVAVLFLAIPAARWVF